MPQSGPLSLVPELRKKQVAEVSAKLPLITATSASLFSVFGFADWWKLWRKLPVRENLTNQNLTYLTCELFLQERLSHPETRKDVVKKVFGFPRSLIFIA
eukprot:Lithocolla_globosa_v1_NODE_2237_length_2094_cov_23.293771.p2 type:complete len:100 gc:universal NODE_2237_length_2094_cov_23.293771:854-1153(+)